MRAAIATVLSFATWTAAASEIPLGFRGVWGTYTSCPASAWRGVGQNDDDRVVQITAKSFLAFESGCDVRSVKAAKIFRNQWGKIISPTELTFTCSGEGLTERVRELWDINSTIESDILSVQDAKTRKITTYYRCK
ncbi:hypothetical protein [Methylobacterium variabile]|uniref:hypothetical protein n=1 Tax=Methylobacterium variabile TaxID=298794 RepID=UPI0012EE8F79|nr:hypothetical protein [Methylobacterium variabile]